jgi:hypothetical protein
MASLGKTNGQIGEMLRRRDVVRMKALVEEKDAHEQQSAGVIHEVRWSPSPAHRISIQQVSQRFSGRPHHV